MILKSDFSGEITSIPPNSDCIWWQHRHRADGNEKSKRSDEMSKPSRRRSPAKPIDRTISAVTTTITSGETSLRRSR